VAFPFWKQLPAIDISMVDDIPKVLDVLRAIHRNFDIGRICMAAEFRAHNDEHTRFEFLAACDGIEIVEEPHVVLKQRVPAAIGLIRTGDTVQYAKCDSGMVLIRSVCQTVEFCRLPGRPGDRVAWGYCCRSAWSFSPCKESRK
jgi:D-ribose pyranase